MPSRLDDISWPVRTKRLLLRPAVADDAEATRRIRRIEAVSHWMTSAPTPLEAYRAQFDTPDRLDRVLILELDAQIIGDLMLAVEDGWSSAEAGH